MTLSILTCDVGRNQLGAAALTGNLCVGGWVLCADRRWGVVASQGYAPNTLWSEQVFSRLAFGESVEQAVACVIEADEGCAYRQLGVIDRYGNAASFTGDKNTNATATVAFPGGLVIGNMLASEQVAERAAEAFLAQSGTLPERLLKAIEAAYASGGDARGAQSAALLHLDPMAPPLDLRIDDSRQPVESLIKLYQKTRQPAYQAWLNVLPTEEQPRKMP